MTGELGFDQGNDLLVGDVLDIDRIVFRIGLLLSCQRRSNNPPVKRPVCPVAAADQYGTVYSLCQD